MTDQFPKVCSPFVNDINIREQKIASTRSLEKLLKIIILSVYHSGLSTATKSLLKFGAVTVVELFENDVALREFPLQGSYHANLMGVLAGNPEKVTLRLVTELLL